MKKFLVLLWILLPLPVVVLHFGRGQQWLANDKASAFLKQAEIAEHREDWQQADQLYREAAKSLNPESHDLKLRVELAQVRTHFRMGDAMAAIDGADKLLEEKAMANMPADFQRESRELAGRIHYYAGWVMRLEGASRDLWMEEAELARQNFRLLAEQQQAAGDGANDNPTKQKENLESAVQLQRLSMTELMARPLPAEGKGMGNQGLSEQMGKRRGQRGKQPGKTSGDGEGPLDKGAGMNRFEPGSGS
jgi:hypothetical protein